MLQRSWDLSWPRGLGGAGRRWGGRTGHTARLGDSGPVTRCCAWRESWSSGASVRDFGSIWVSARTAGEKLAAALEARKRWEQLGQQAPEIGVRATGSISLVCTRWGASATAASPGSAARSSRAYEKAGLDLGLGLGVLGRLGEQVAGSVNPDTAP